ncbi:MAG: cyclic pyranopterin monophosphate synthase MoaC [Verrucomicrobiae bacterium]|nr:cyclic pyranopterin monophosphate synthase MoaC [Verrucomicrobiae bacterium]
MKKLSHLTPQGKIKMVDVGSKPIQKRIATATAELHLQPATVRLLKKKALPKGDALTCAQVAGIQAAKKTSELIPLCHLLALNSIQIEFKLQKDRLKIFAIVSCQEKTGAEMEALTAVAITALTLYDMTKAVDKTMKVTNLRLLAKEKF